MSAGKSELFKSVAIVHPAMLDLKDVEAVAVPFGFYPSKVRNDDTSGQISI